MAGSTLMVHVRTPDFKVLVGVPLRGRARRAPMTGEARGLSLAVGHRLMDRAEIAWRVPARAVVVTRCETMKTITCLVAFGVTFASLLGVSLRAGEPAAACCGATGYPGAPPGPVMIRCEGQTITIGNEAIAASWTWSPEGLKSRSLRDVQTGRVVALAGEAFRIVLGDGTSYAASALALEGPLRVTELAPEPRAARLSARIFGRQVELPLRSADHRLRVVWRAIARDGGNSVREEIDLTPDGGDLSLRAIVWVDAALPGAKEAGSVDGSPIVAGNLFLGADDPMATNTVAGGKVVCRLDRRATLHRGDRLTLSFVAGATPEGQPRRGFLYYLERERAHPYRPFLHYNSWYDVMREPFPMNEATALDAIRLFGERFIKPHGVVMDALVFDDGWDDPTTLWKFHPGFPAGFTPLAALCKEYHTRPGVWLSPFGGYGEPREQRLAFGRKQGYETNAAGFSLAGPKYYEAFKQACVNMIRTYGVNHFKFDGIAAGMYASGGADYVLDTEAMRRLMTELRQEDPALYINLTTGSWPSPFWLRYADSVWRQGGDMGLAGKGSKQQQWLTYRDQETYRNIVGKGPLYPLNSLMTQGVAYSRQGTAGEPTFNSAGFRDDVHAFFGSGTGLQELYIQPGKLTPEDWRVLAEAAKWSRASADVLVDTHWIGGDPSRGEVYGYASWAPRKGVIMLRNPDDRPHEFALDVGTAFELPPGSARRFTLESPWTGDPRPANRAEAGKPASIRLKPFEVIVFDATPAG